jgi:tetratricopeptide (TPR) repeat protein
MVRLVTHRYHTPAHRMWGVYIIAHTKGLDEAWGADLDQIVHALAIRSALVLLTRREGTTGYQVPDLEHTHSLPLAPITAEDAVRAVVAATDDAPLRPGDVAVLAERAAGNPLFLAELLETLRDGGDVASLPDNVQALVTSQIDRLDPEHRAVLRMAAVLGQSFQADELRALSDDPLPTEREEFWQVFDSILAFTAPGTLRFRHALVRDAAYEELPYRRRRALHARAGDAIAAQADRPEAEAELLSLHYFHANRFDDAWRYARVAATRALDKYANVEAAALFERAISAARRGADVTVSELAAVWEELGDVTDRSGIFDRALQSYRTARRLHGDDAVAAAGLLLKEAWIAERTGRYSEAVRAVRKGLKQLGDAMSIDAQRARARLHAWYGTVRQAQARPREAIRECEAAIEIATAIDDPATEAQARFTLDWAYVSMGQSDRAHHSQRALELYTELGDLTGQAVVLNNLGGFAYFDGRWDEAVELYEQARVLRERTGNAVDAAIGMYNIGEVLIDQGHCDKAHSYIVEADRVWRASDYRGGIGIAQMQLARLEAARGEFDAALTRLAAARATLADIHADGDVVEVDLRTAETQLAAGDHRAAGKTVDETLRRDAALGGVIDHAPLLRVLAGVLLATGDLVLAEQTILASLDEARDRDASFEIARALEVLADIERRTGRDDDAAEHAAEARERFGALGVVAPAGVAG